MGFFSKLFGGRSKHDAPPPAAAPIDAAASASKPVATGTDAMKPIVIGTTPPVDLGNGLTVHAFSHGYPGRDVALWTMISQGMAAHGQRELVFSVARRPGENIEGVAGPLLKLLRTIHRFAQQGHHVSWGGMTEVGEDLVAPGMRGVVYADAQPITGLPIPDNALTAILLGRDELELVKQFGAYRLLARLGRQQRHFPFPPWTDRDRKRAVHNEDGKSMLNMFGARITFQTASIVLEDEQVVLQLQRSSGAQLAKLLTQVPAQVPFAILARAAPRADAWLVWSPGQTEPEATTGPNPSRSSITGGFLGCLLDTGQADQVIQLEDGFTLMLSADAWALCLRAIASGGPFALRSSSGSKLGFALRWT